MESIIETKKVWYVTGTSSGIGFSIVKKLLINGHKVISVSRTPETIEQQIPEEHKCNLLAVKTDICNRESIEQSFEKGIKAFGKIDCVVNNAGMGIVGAVGELSEEEMRKAFDVNFFSMFNICQIAIPHLKKTQGYIFNISSVLGWLTVSEYSAYNATKFAVNSLTFTLQQELSPFGIKVVLLSPSGFKTEFVDKNMIYAKNLIEGDYKSKERGLWLDDIVNNARGDPDKFADVIIQITESNEPPKKNYFLGTHALEFLSNEFKSQIHEMNSNASLSITTDFETAPPMKVDLLKLQQ